MRTLIDFVKELKPYSYLEVGVNEGDSLKKVLDNSNIKEVVVCDNWNRTYGGKGRGNKKHIKLLLDKYKSLDNYKIIDGASQSLLPTIIGLMKFDLINIDADHSFEGTRQDIENSLDLIKPDGKIIVHDIRHPSHRKDKLSAIADNNCEIEEELKCEKGYNYAIIRPVA